MNYFEIFNKVMLELNYRKIAVFANIYKTEHLRILENINRVNADVLSAFEWDFLARRKVLRVEAGEISAKEPVEGKILKVFEGKKRLKYNPFYELFYQNSAPNGAYGVFGDEFLIQKADKPRDFTIFYQTNKIVKRADGTHSEQMTFEDDESLIPQPFAEQILVYGTCIKTKANPNFPKFGVWNSLFKSALVSLRAKSTLTNEDAPSVRLKKG